MTRNAEQNQRRREERREKILSQARRLFAVRGLAATKIADIAAAVGMSQGLLYHYFRSKEEIFTEIIRDAFEKMHTAVRLLEALPLPPHEKIRLAIGHLLRSIAESEDFASTVMLIAQAGVAEATPAEARAIIDAESGIPYEMVTRIMRAGQQDGTIKPYAAAELSMLFWTTVKGLALHRAVNGAAFTAPDARIITSMFLTDEASGDSHV